MGKPNRLVALLDSLLNGGGPGSVHLSRFHYDRLVRSVSGEPPGRLRRRVLMEQAAYALSHGARVTDVAFASGYESAKGFSHRAPHRTRPLAHGRDAGARRPRTR